MLALKKKREAEKKAAAAAAAAEAESAKTAEEPKTEKVSLLGIGGKKKTKSGEGSATKKRTPGEIRIQKGMQAAMDSHRERKPHSRLSLQTLLDWTAARSPRLTFPIPTT